MTTAIDENEVKRNGDDPEWVKNFKWAKNVSRAHLVGILEGHGYSQGQQDAIIETMLPALFQEAYLRGINPPAVTEMFRHAFETVTEMESNVAEQSRKLSC
jgi:hypothetical protein